MSIGITPFHRFRSIHPGWFLFGVPTPSDLADLSAGLRALADYADARAAQEAYREAGDAFRVALVQEQLDAIYAKLPAWAKDES